MAKISLILLVILIGLSSCTNQADTTNQMEEQLILVNYQKQVDSLNRVVADIKSNSHYWMQYRYLIRDYKINDHRKEILISLNEREEEYSPKMQKIVKS
jgi:hypothetical protein